MNANARLGLMGKHPGYGDFLRAGLTNETAEALENWLDKTLSELRDSLGNNWAVFWDHSQDLRFWTGRAVLGCTVAGVLRPSRDRAGRRYPLILAAEAVTGPTLWAHHPEGNLDALLSSAASVDAERAILNRSYWWAPGTKERAAVWLGCSDLPTAPALGWLFAGLAAEPTNEAANAQ